MKVGAFLKICRSKAGFSQEELADRLCINQSDISKYETDRKEPVFSIWQAWISNTQTIEVAVAFMYYLDGIIEIHQLMSMIGGFIFIRFL